MTGVRLVEVTESEGETRLDRWFKRHYPGLTHGRLEKLLRTGQVRVDGGRAKGATRLEPGMVVRVPPLDDSATAPVEPGSTPRGPKPLSPRDIAAVKSMIIYRDADVIALDKPHGLAVQGGTGTTRHLDGMLDALMFDYDERPKLVHRLDKDTSGVILLARTTRAAQWLTRAFRDKTARKTYWAVVAGVPKPHRGKIDLPIAKAMSGDREKVIADEDDGRDAITYYAVVENLAQRAAWIALLPLTGRTHQLRVHCAEIGTPILGDGKYGGAKATIEGLGGRRQLHLHARSIELQRPDGSVLHVTAPLPPHMRETWEFLGFPREPSEDPFATLDL
jgi:23S rRNA pseudouridine955/2504/2580 synthase